MKEKEKKREKKKREKEKKEKERKQKKEKKQLKRTEDNVTAQDQELTGKYQSLEMVPMNAITHSDDDVDAQQLPPDPDPQPAPKARPLSTTIRDTIDMLANDENSLPFLNLDALAAESESTDDQELSENDLDKVAAAGEFVYFHLDNRTGKYNKILEVFRGCEFLLIFGQTPGKRFCVLGRLDFLEDEVQVTVDQSYGQDADAHDTTITTAPDPQPETQSQQSETCEFRFVLDPLGAYQVFVYYGIFTSESNVWF